MLIRNKLLEGYNNFRSKSVVMVKLIKLRVVEGNRTIHTSYRARLIQIKITFLSRRVLTVFQNCNSLNIVLSVLSFFFSAMIFLLLHHKLFMPFFFSCQMTTNLFHQCSITYIFLYLVKPT